MYANVNVNATCPSFTKYVKERQSSLLICRICVYIRTNRYMERSTCSICVCIHVHMQKRRSGTVRSKLLQFVVHSESLHLAYGKFVSLSHTQAAELQL